jgi:hypothetical protein
VAPACCAAVMAGKNLGEFGRRQHTECRPLNGKHGQMKRVGGQRGDVGWLC